MNTINLTRTTVMVAAIVLSWTATILSDDIPGATMSGSDADLATYSATDWYNFHPSSSGTAVTLAAGLPSPIVGNVSKWGGTSKNHTVVAAVTLDTLGQYGEITWNYSNISIASGGYFNDPCMIILATASTSVTSSTGAAYTLFLRLTLASNDNESLLNISFGGTITAQQTILSANDSDGYMDNVLVTTAVNWERNIRIPCNS